MNWTTSLKWRAIFVCGTSSNFSPLYLIPKGLEGKVDYLKPYNHDVTSIPIFCISNWMKLILLQLTCRTSRWYRQFRCVVPPQCWEHGSPPPLGQTQLLDNGSLRLVKLVGHTGGSHKELSVTPLVTHGGHTVGTPKLVTHRMVSDTVGHTWGSFRWVNPTAWCKRIISSPTHLFQVECVLCSSPDKGYRWTKFASTSIHMSRAR